MSPLETLEIIVLAGEIIAAPLLFFIPRKDSNVSDAFQAALAALVQRFTDKLAAMQTELDAAKAAVNSAVAATDAEATAEIIAATPAA